MILAIACLASVMLCNSQTENKEFVVGFVRSTTVVDILSKWQAGLQTDTWTGGGLKAPFTKSFRMPLPAWEFLEDGRLIMSDGSKKKIASFTMLTTTAIVISYGLATDTMFILQSAPDRITLQENKKFDNGQELRETLDLTK